MDAHDFDRWIRSLGVSSSRREVTRASVVGAAAALVSLVGPARAVAAQTDCRGRGARCRQSAECCSGRCSGKGKCVCRRGTTACGQICCDSGQECCEGTCVTCGPDQRCCNGTCMDLDDDRDHCGACGRMCPERAVLHPGNLGSATSECRGGRCVCAMRGPLLEEPDAPFVRIEDPCGDACCLADACDESHGRCCYDVQIGGTTAKGTEFCCPEGHVRCGRGSTRCVPFAGRSCTAATVADDCCPDEVCVSGSCCPEERAFSGTCCPINKPQGPGGNCAPPGCPEFCDDPGGRRARRI
jgi:hypothetical protein